MVLDRLLSAGKKTGKKAVDKAKEMDKEMAEAHGGKDSVGEAFGVGGRGRQEVDLGISGGGDRDMPNVLGSGGPREAPDALGQMDTPTGFDMDNDNTPEVPSAFREPMGDDDSDSLF